MLSTKMVSESTYRKVTLVARCRLKRCQKTEETHRTKAKILFQGNTLHYTKLFVLMVKYDGKLYMFARETQYFSNSY